MKRLRLSTSVRRDEATKTINLEKQKGHKVGMRFIALSGGKNG
jgi:hypothetical protein